MVDILFFLNVGVTFYTLLVAKYATSTILFMLLVVFDTLLEDMLQFTVALPTQKWPHTLQLWPNVSLPPR